MNIEENNTDESYFNCLLSSLLSFWVVLKRFWGVFLEERKKTWNGSKTTHNKQVKYDLTVLISSIFIYIL